MTKESAGDTGSRIGELTRDLRVAKENAAKFQKEATDNKQTLEIRTENFLKEKQEMKAQLDNALSELRRNNQDSNGMSSENSKLQ